MFEEFFNNPKGWLNARGPHSEIVMSSRVRLARNIEKIPFPNRAGTQERYEVLKKMRDASQDINSLKEALFVEMDELTPLDKQFLLERHLISQEHSQASKGKALVVSSDEIVSMMINEEDHIRLQVLVSGFDLENSWDLIDRLDNELSQRIPFAFLYDLGYLTSCTTNIGTALRASCMLHLPALVLTKRINKILELLAKLSFATRGLFGEGTQALGNLFQISNQISLGVSEQELMDNLAGVVKQVKEQEEHARQTLFKKNRYTVEDNVWRAWGILRNARLITTKETLSHLSMLFLGLDLGIIKDIKREEMNNLFITIQPAHLQKMEGKTLKEEERDYIRANLLRSSLGG
jgi:protein arginine kinase